VRSGPRHIGGGTWVLAVCFLAAFAVSPLLIVRTASGVDDEAFVCRAEVESRLAETLAGKLEFLQVRAVAGRSPAERFVITIDHGYTAGVGEYPGAAQDPALAPGRAPWLEGTPMDEDTYYGEQYLFFDQPQLYVSQVRSGLFWPSQVERLKTLYLSPFTGFGSLYLVWVYPFMEEYSLVSWLFLMARFLLVCAAVAAAGIWRKRDARWTPGIVWVTGAYALSAVVLAAFSL
jgi:hypothetical protein